MNGFRCFTTLLLVVALSLQLAAIPAAAEPTLMTLDECIDLALKNNPSAKIAQLGQEKSYWSLKQARAAKGFTIGFTHTDQRYNTPPNVYSSIYTWTTTYSNAVSLTLPLYSGGKLESQIDQGKQNLEVANQNLVATQQQLKQDVTNDYFNALQYQNLKTIYQETVNNYAAHLKIVEAQFREGMVAKSDVLSTAVSMADSENDRLVYENSFDMAMATLKNDICVPLNTELNLSDNIPFNKLRLSLPYCTRYALLHRPEIAQYEAKIKIAQDDVTIARSGYLPTVDLNAAQNWSDTELPGNKDPYWQVAVTTSWNVFDSGVTRAKLRQAVLELASVREEARQKADSITLEVRQYYHSMEEAEKRMVSSQVAIEQAQESLRIAEVRYKAGLGTNLDVLDAVLALNNAKTNNVQGLYDYQNYKAKLAKSMGIGVAESFPDETAQSPAPAIDAARKYSAEKSSVDDRQTLRLPLKK
ncbi:MAG TPA: TolC family protein [Patescibacteria group bacterium]|nr:TolC family protein [Patescibacteria group bacterium]